MRTLNPQEAKLFFVPVLLNYFDKKSEGWGSLCLNGVCDDELLQQAARFLSSEKSYLKRYPERHVVSQNCPAIAWKLFWLESLKYENWTVDVYSNCLWAAWKKYDDTTFPF